MGCSCSANSKKRVAQPKPTTTKRFTINGQVTTSTISDKLRNKIVRRVIGH